jgi:dTDP-D-glucose 4,6-dehydratase
MVYLITTRTLLWVKSMYGKGQNPRKWIGHIIVYAVGLAVVVSNPYSGEVTEIVVHGHS